MTLSKSRLRRAVTVLLIVVGCLLLGAVLLGVLNATVGKGEWNFGWSSYRYDDKNYEIGNGSIPYAGITRIEIDWIDGRVELVPCDDAYISLSESTENHLTDAARLRWKVSEDGRTLTVKYRASSWILGSGEKNINKSLCVRIPEKILASMEHLELTAAGADLMLQKISLRSASLLTTSGSVTVSEGGFSSLSVSSETGKIKLHTDVKDRLTVASARGDVEWNTNVCSAESAIETKSGRVSMALPEEVSFALEYQTVSGVMMSDLPLEGATPHWTRGDGASKIKITTQSGSLRIAKK